MLERIRNNWLPVIFIICFLFYAGLRIANTTRSLNALVSISDTRSYLRIAKGDILDVEFYTDARPPGFPFLLKVARGNEMDAALLQTVISIFSWGILALILARQFSSPGLKSFAFILVLFISLGYYVLIWDTVVLTESLSLSLMVLIMAGWLWLLESWHWYKALLLVLISIAWAFTRDTNFWLLSLITGFTALGGIYGKRRWLGFAIILLIVFVLASVASEHGRRWVFPFQNVFTARILPDLGAVEFFSDCGMPVTENLLALSGGNASSNDRAFYNDAVLDGYRNWQDTSGKLCYLKWLTLDPSRSLILPIKDFPTLIAFEDITRFFPKTYRPILPSWLDVIIYPQFGITVTWLCLMLLMIFTAKFPSWRKKPLWIVWAVLTLSLYPHLFLIWHGDTLGLDRHALGIIIGYFLSFWFFILLTLDWVYERQNEN